MVACRRCGRSLTHPRSVKNQIGPRCRGKEMTKKQFELSQAKPEDLTLERQTLIILHQSIGKGSGTSPNTKHRHIKRMLKAGYSDAGDWSYHSFAEMLARIEQGQESGIEYKYLVSDTISGKDIDGSYLSQMVITLFEKGRK